MIGRGDDAAVLLESPTVSRHHARIRIANGVASIEDLDSKNGTFVGSSAWWVPEGWRKANTYGSERSC